MCDRVLIKMFTCRLHCKLLKANGKWSLAAAATGPMTHALATAAAVLLLVKFTVPPSH